MPESTQYTFTHTEIVELLIRKAGIREGQWQLLLNFGFAAGNAGPDDKNLSPTGFIAIQNIGIQKATGPLNNLTVDAAKVAP